MWPFDSKNVVAQNNKFMNAHGPQDSYGAHIDFGNENVVFQYNFSYNNEGGFVEILGDNINCGYRYNISVNDGYRVDPNNNQWDKKGKIFWVGNFCGNNQTRCPSTGTFIYNNTIFVNDTLNPEIYFWPNIGDVHVYNNLIYVGSNGNKIPTLISNTLNTLDISHNIFYDSSRINLDNDLLNNALFLNPQMMNSSILGVNNPMAYKVQTNSPAIGSGRLINGSTDTTNYLNNNGGKDYFGNSISNFDPPSIGAFNEELMNSINFFEDNSLTHFPSPTIDKVHLFFKDYNGLVETDIYDIKGQYIGHCDGEVISLINLKKGIYILKVKLEKEIKELRVLKL